MDNFPQRLQQLRGEMSKSAFADMVGIANQKISNYEAGTVKPTFEVFLQIALNTEVNLNWLVTGKGPMYRTANIDLVKEPDIQYGDQGKEVHIYSKVAAGKPIDLWNEEYSISIRHPVLDKIRGDLYGFIVEGDSMTPRFRQKDLVITKHLMLPGEMPRNKDFVVTVFQDIHGSINANLKMFQWLKKNEEFLLTPLNTYYESTTHKVKDVRFFFQVVLAISEINYKK